MTPESIFTEAWRQGIELVADGDKIRYRPLDKMPQELVEEIREHKAELLRFLSTWINTPQGPGKILMFLDDGRCAVVLRDKPDVAAWVRLRDISI